ncbi:MAG: hypothetical protein M5R36_05010 [Deltaproteobacteria bacterium]|nr:hypothetical protein [Deltaproteobacteria bacterium]
MFEADFKPGPLVNPVRRRVDVQAVDLVGIDFKIVKRIFVLSSPGFFVIVESTDRLRWRKRLCGALHASASEEGESNE